MPFVPENPVCIHCAAASVRGEETRPGKIRHRPSVGWCEWHPSHREASEPFTEEACKSLFARLLRSAICVARGESDFDSLPSDEQDREREQREARAWMEEGNDGLFAFCCEVLDLDAGVLLEVERRKWRRAA